MIELASFRDGSVSVSHALQRPQDQVKSANLKSESERQGYRKYHCDCHYFHVSSLNWISLLCCLVRLYAIEHNRELLRMREHHTHFRVADKHNAKDYLDSGKIQIGIPQKPEYYRWCWGANRNQHGTPCHRAPCVDLRSQQP